MPFELQLIYGLLFSSAGLLAALASWVYLRLERRPSVWLGVAAAGAVPYCFMLYSVAYDFFAGEEVFQAFYWSHGKGGANAAVAYAALATAACLVLTTVVVFCFQQLWLRRQRKAFAERSAP